jgi:hypothetical protein
MDKVQYSGLLNTKITRIRKRYGARIPFMIPFSTHEEEKREETSQVAWFSSLIKLQKMLYGSISQKFS